MEVHPALQDLAVLSSEIRVSGDRLLVVTPEEQVTVSVVGLNRHETRFEVASWAQRGNKPFVFPFAETSGMYRRNIYSPHFSLQVYEQLRRYSNALMQGLRGEKTGPAVRFYDQKIHVLSITQEGIDLRSSQHPAPLLFERDVVREYFDKPEISSLDPRLHLFCEIIWKGLEGSGEQASLPLL